MIGNQIDFESVRIEYSTNKQRVFTSSKKGDSGFERLILSDFPLLEISPKFKIHSSAKIFTIGSCFARNIEAVLLGKGFDVLTSDFLVPGEYYELQGLGARSGALNVYTPHTIYQLLELACSNRLQSEVGSIKVEDTYIDMLCSGLKPLSFEQLIELRRQLASTYSKIKEADLVVLTLGYTEGWFDLQDSIWVNRAPVGSPTLMRNASRFNFLNANFSQIKEFLNSFLFRLKEFSDRDVKVLLTVSPVPLHATFTNKDVAIANLYSKNTLHSAALCLADEYDWVDYYPSYEMVSFAAPNLAWEEDGQHVKSSIVKRVIDKFVENYLDSM